VGDAQAGHEKTLTGLLAALAGVNVVYGLGMLESGVTIDFGQLVMDNEFAGMIKHVLKGIPVDDENLAVDVIHDIGPLKDFLAHKHTLKHMRSQSQPSLIDRRRRSKWQELGGTDIYERASAKAREILETHEPDPLPDGVLETIRSIIEGAEEELGVGKEK
jgi:trimethylamine---corrinoid protein Co-methyltransferase